ncbi:MAG: hypothetical protein HKN82_12280 [Akkermansiaceae bacterium]|nr:hypothetical protein [Akkermansiaceae bacterium]
MMKVTPPSLPVPIYLKLPDDGPVEAAEDTYYVASRDGLFLCRRNEFFRSCVPARQFPCALGSHEPSLDLEFPKIPRRMFERIVGYFSRVARRHGSEAAVLILWNRRTRRIELHIPKQVATMSASAYSNYRFPMTVAYETPLLPPELIIIGDVHSHVDGAAYSSGMDKDDESFRPGAHIVVGRISQEPPDVHVEFVVDGVRHVRIPGEFIEGYRKRRENEVPDEWMDQLSVKVVPYSYWTRNSSGGSRDAAPDETGNPAT